jgi:hypothetical protein
VRDGGSSREAGGRIEGEELVEEVGGAGVEGRRGERRPDVIRTQPTGGEEGRERESMRKRKGAIKWRDGRERTSLFRP